MTELDYSEYSQQSGFSISGKHLYVVLAIGTVATLAMTVGFISDIPFLFKAGGVLGTAGVTLYLLLAIAWSTRHRGGDGG